MMRTSSKTLVESQSVNTVGDAQPDINPERAGKAGAVSPSRPSGTAIAGQSAELHAACDTPRGAPFIDLRQHQ
jgi:hypothetical protein